MHVVENIYQNIYLFFLNETHDTVKLQMSKFTLDSSRKQKEYLFVTHEMVR